MIHKMNVNPWISMWTNPRKTIREIVNIAPKKGLFWLALIYGLQYLLNIAHSLSLGKSFTPLVIIIASIVLSPIAGFLWFYLLSLSLYWGGKLLKGQAKFFQLLSSVAWSSIPYLINICMWFLFLVTSTFSIFVEYSEGFTFAFISMMTLITIIWSVVLLIKCIKEVQDFSYWRALGNYILGLLIYFSLVVGAGAILAVISYAIVNFI